MVIAAFVIGVGGKFAYDTHQEHERQKALDQKALDQKALEESWSDNNCSFCTLVKEDMKRTREEVEIKRALEAQAE